MDLMTRRRALLARVQQPIPPEAIQFVTIANAFNRANGAKTEVDAVMSAAGITESNKIIVLKKANVVQDGQLVVKDWINLNGAPGIFARFRGSSFSGYGWGDGSGLCCASSGDKYYVIDPAESYSGLVTTAVVNQNITNAAPVKEFIDQYLPQDGWYFVWVTKRPEDYIQYDFVGGVLSSTGNLTCWYRADSSEKTNLMFDFGSGYLCTLHSGDTINYIKIQDLT